MRTLRIALLNHLKWLAWSLLLALLSLLLWWALSSRWVYKILFGVPLMIGCGRVGWNVVVRPVIGFARANARMRRATALVAVVFVGLIAVVLFGPPFWVRYSMLTAESPLGEYEATFFMRHHEMFFGESQGWNVVPKELRYEVVEKSSGKVVMRGGFPGSGCSFGYRRSDNCLSVGGGGKLDWDVLKLDSVK